MTVAVDSNTVAYLPLATDLVDVISSNAWASTGSPSISADGLFLDGVNDYLTIGPLGSLTDFSVEFYAKLPSLSSVGLLNSAADAFVLSTSSAGALRFAHDGGTLYSIAAAFSAETFCHVFIGRSESNTYLALNGQLSKIITDWSTAVNLTGMWFGKHYNGSMFFSYTLKDLRISNICRYTASFTPPTFGDDSLARRRQVV